eukprot:554277-Ditylum_brightwellii.AAC.1
MRGSGGPSSAISTSGITCWLEVESSCAGHSPSNWAFNTSSWRRQSPSTPNCAKVTKMEGNFWCNA